MSKWILTSIVFLCALGESSAQYDEASLTQKLNAYQATWPRVSIHLVFNQEKYSPGDTVYFKTYFLTEDLQGVAGTQLININLINSNGEALLHFMMMVNDGIGTNQLTLPDSLSAGIYLLTAHSTWMQNFDPAPIYKKEIWVVRKKSLLPSELSWKIVAEGGHLVRDVSNKISIRSYRAASTVQIVDGAGQEMGRTSTDLNGVGTITFTPIRNAAYFVRLVGASQQAPLPTTEEDGCSLLLTAEDNEAPLKLRITSPNGSTFQNQKLMLIVRSGGKIYHVKDFSLEQRGEATLELSRTILPAGIAHLSILDRNNTTVASRAFYHHRENPIKATVQFLRPVYQPREKIAMEVLLTDNKDQPVSGEFSVKAVNASLFDSQKENSFSDDLNVVFPPIENYAVDQSEGWKQRLDNLLVSETGDLPWKEIISSSWKKPRFQFTSVIKKNGTVYYGDTGEPVPDNTEIMFYLQKSKVRYRTFSQGKGKVNLTIPYIYGEDEFFFLGEAWGKEITNLKVVWEEEQLVLPRAPFSTDAETKDPYAAFAANCRLIDQSYSGSTAIQASKNQQDYGVDFETQIKGADVTKSIKDYTLFPTMEELVKEVIPSIYFRKTGRTHIVRVGLSQPMISTADPLYIIDGIATKNTAFFLSLKPVDLLTIKIVNSTKKLLPLGLLGKNGIVIVQTKLGTAREPLDDPSKLIKGLNRPISFTPFDYSGMRYQHKPNFKSTVYWNPTIKTDANGKATVEFSCSDDMGPMHIRLEGFGAGGKAFSKYLEVIVSEKK